MATVQKILIIGGGFSGMCAAIQLRKAGYAVDMVEIDKDWRSYGAGITISGATLRALDTVGVMSQVMEQGWCADGLDICDAAGNLIKQLPTPRVAGPNIPGGGAIMRPVLARILAQATLAAGASVRLGVTFTTLEDRGTQVDVTFTDGTAGCYDMVIGADGLFSSVRRVLFPEAPTPKHTGQGCWRAVLPRPADVVRPALFMAEGMKAGINPVSKDEMYMFVNDHRPDNEFIDPVTWPRVLAELLAGFGGPIGRIRDGLDEQSRIIYRPLEGLLMPLPWAKGRVVLIGDTVHATTPHLASGAGIGIEDAIVLADELVKAETIEQAFDRFQARRYERCRMVVHNSGRLGEIEMSGGSREEHAQLMADSVMALAAEI